jgi:hypothetical protein
MTTHPNKHHCCVSLNVLYADDLTLLASSAEDLQALLDALHEFSMLNNLEVNVGKCAVVVFGRSAPRPGQAIPEGGWVYSGQAIPLVSEFRYLGIVFHQTKGVSACVSALQSAGMRAMWGMLGKCGTLDIRSLEVQVQLFETLVAPVLGYCSEVWAPTLLRNCDSADACMDNDLHKVQRCSCVMPSGACDAVPPGGFCYGSLVVVLWCVLGSTQ